MKRTIRTDQDILELFGITGSVTVDVSQLKFKTYKSRQNPQLKGQVCPPVPIKRGTDHSFNNRTHKCAQCNKNYTSKIGVQKHINRMHSETKKFKCSFENCTFSFSVTRDLSRQEMVHRGEKPFKCELCPYRARQKAHIKQHVETWHADGRRRERNFKCASCDYSAYTRQMLSFHTRVHTGERPYKCTSCNYAARQSAHLQNHLLIHTGEKPYKCGLCNYREMDKNKLAVHTRIHTGEKPFACTICAYKCATSSSLVTHVRILTGEKPYKCSQCNYSATTNDGLTGHLKRNHSAEARLRKFSCVLCSKRFYFRRELCSHISCHTLEKPYLCQYCHRAFGHISGRGSHEKLCRMRPDGIQIKPYKCQYCQHPYSSKNDKLLHEECCKRRPDGLVVKRYNCKLCGKAFSWKNGKNCHEKICKMRPDQSKIKP